MKIKREPYMFGKNMCRVMGIIVEEYTFYKKTADGINIYRAQIDVNNREDYNPSIITITVPEYLIDTDIEYYGKRVEVRGIVATYDSFDEEHADCYIKAQRVFCLSEEVEKRINSVYLKGYICKKTSIIETKNGKRLIKFKLAINFPNGNTQYIYCAAKEPYIDYVVGLQEKSMVEVVGLISSYLLPAEGKNQYVVKHDISVYKMGEILEFYQKKIQE